MKFEDFKIPMTVYHARVNYNYNRKGLRGDFGNPIDTLKYFIIELDVKRRRVHASCNGAAPAWYKATIFKNWQKQKPEENQLRPHRYRVQP